MAGERVPEAAKHPHMTHTSLTGHTGGVVFFLCNSVFGLHQMVQNWQISDEPLGSSGFAAVFTSPLSHGCLFSPLSVR